MWETEKDPFVILGGNSFIQCGSIITYEGKQFFNILHRDSDNRLGIDLDIYDQDGVKIATIRHSSVVDGDSNRFDIHYRADVMTLTDKESDDVLVRINKKPFKIETKFKPQQMLDELTLIATPPPPLNINEIEGILEVTLRTHLPESGFLLIATPKEINVLESEESFEGFSYKYDFFRCESLGMTIEKCFNCGEMIKTNLNDICPSCSIDFTQDIPQITERIESMASGSFLYRNVIRNKVWENYRAKRDEDSRTELLNFYTPLLKKITEEIMSEHPGKTCMDDLISNGMFAILEFIDANLTDYLIQSEEYCRDTLKKAILENIESFNGEPPFSEEISLE